MTDVTPPRILENPPRTTGDSEQDLPILIDWFWRAYQIIVQAVNYVTGLTDDITALTTRVTTAEGDIDDLETIMSRMIDGTVVVSDANNAFTVTFTTALPDTDYIVVAQPIASSGTPTAESFIVAAKTYTTIDFTITLLAAPGAGDSVTYEWQLIKNEVD